MTDELQEILNDINILQKLNSLPIEDVDEVASSLRTKKYAGVYLRTIAMGGKPESALSDCLFKPLIENQEYLNLDINPQMRAGDGWVDYLIRERVSNPVAIEIKPLHFLRSNKIELDSLDNKLRKIEADDKNQIIQYLRNFDYVLLTNMKDVYYFNREAIIDFEPFLREEFISLIDDIKSNKDVWDVVRRKEDRTPKHDLGKRFFSDLKKWYSEFQDLEFQLPTQKQEKVVQLLNKFIFLKTLEDYALIPFNFIRDTYEDKVHRWNAKGRGKIFFEFFNELNNWSYEYYDTELFKEDIFSLIIQNDNNLKLLQIATERILGLSEWSKTFGIGLIHYNYRNIDEDIFGKSYETFLAEERKQQGIFYTPSDITDYMSRILVEELFYPVKNRLLDAIESNDLDNAKQAAIELCEIKIIDPSCGSGSFLVKVLKKIWEVYIDIHNKTEWATKVDLSCLDKPKDIAARENAIRDIREFLKIGRESLNGISTISSIILKHLYGIDIDEKAIDVAKVNIWKEAIKLVPQSFRYKLLPSDINHVLPNLELNFINANSVVDFPLNEIADIISLNYKNEIIELHKTRDEYLNNPYNPELIENAIIKKNNIRESLDLIFTEKYGSLNTKQTFLPLELFHAYFNKDGDQLAINDLGFSGVIGNPPWENIKPIIKEFASFHADIFGEISKFSIASKDFDTTFKKALKENGKLKEEWLLYCHDIQELSKFIRNTYELYGDSGDLSYQKLFLERAINLTKNNGVISFLVPSGFHTDEGQKDLRRSILSYYTLKILMSFENRGHKWFHDIDPRFKFDSIIIRKTRNDDNLPIKERFYIQDIQEIENPLSIYSSDIIKFSPSTLGFVEFRNQRDMEIATKIRGEHQFLGELGYRLSSEFHMTNDNDLFCDIKKKKDNGLILYEGKMFHQYNSEYELPRYCILKDDGRERLISKEIHRIKRFLKKDEHEIEFEKDDFNKNKFKLIYEDYRLSYRAVASSTNERTLIAAILPPNIFTGHSINFFMNYDYKVQSGKVIQTHIDYKDLLYLQALINSFTVDYYIRLRVSANVTMFFIFEIPMPNISKPLKDEIVRISLNLLPNTEVFEKFANQLGISKNNMSESEKRDLRALLEAKIARDIYKLTIEETEYILDTFTFGNIDKELIDNIKKELK